MFALLGSEMLCSRSQAQDGSQRNPIFDTERNHHPSEPMGYALTGGPTSDQTKEALQLRIKEQSEDQATLFGFRQTFAKVLDLEVHGNAACAIGFEAGVEFSAPGRWASRYRGRPLTFVILKPDADLRGTDSINVVDIQSKGERYAIQGYALFTFSSNRWAVAGFGQSSRPIRQSAVPDEASAQCITQLKQIGLAFRMWALDNGDHYPFNVSTRSGGTMELCAPGKDGFEERAAVHFQVMSNELASPKILVCPADTSRHPAADFRNLQTANVSYFVRSGTNIDETNPEEVLAKCPIHGHLCRCDGSVQSGPGGTRQ